MYAIANKTTSTVSNSGYSSTLKQAVNLGGDLGTFLSFLGEGHRFFFCAIVPAKIIEPFRSLPELAHQVCPPTTITTAPIDRTGHSSIYYNIECVALRIRVRADYLSTIYFHL